LGKITGLSSSDGTVGSRLFFSLNFFVARAIAASFGLFLMPVYVFDLLQAPWKPWPCFFTFL
jgi:hypothetical protein